MSTLGIVYLSHTPVWHSILQPHIARLILSAKLPDSVALNISQLSQIDYKREVLLAGQSECCL